MITPRMPSGSSPEDDPTGVRALLSSLPEPEPMPAYLVERISASLAAEQAQRTRPDPPVVSPLTPSRRRLTSSRLVVGVLGAAAAVTVVAVVGTNLVDHDAGQASSAAASIGDSTRSAESDQKRGGQGFTDKRGYDAGQMHIQLSETRYVAARFADQARTLPSRPSSPVPPNGAESAGVGPVATANGLADCLRGLKTGPADQVVADLAFYEGAPAVVIVTTQGSRHTAYVVGRNCSARTPAVLHAPVVLP